MVRHDRLDDATRLMLAAAPETMALQDTDEWWRERRSLARKLLDQEKFLSAYQIVRDPPAPASETYRADFYFMSGWIALRYLDEPATARALFAHIDDGSANPIVLARELLARARDRSDRRADEARGCYEAAPAIPPPITAACARQTRPRRIELRAPAPANAPMMCRTCGRTRARRRHALYACERDVVLYLPLTSPNRART